MRRGPMRLCPTMTHCPNAASTAPTSCMPCLLSFWFPSLSSSFLSSLLLFDSCCFLLCCVSVLSPNPIQHNTTQSDPIFAHSTQPAEMSFRYHKLPPRTPPPSHYFAHHDDSDEAENGEAGSSNFIQLSGRQIPSSSSSSSSPSSVSAGFVPPPSLYSDLPAFDSNVVSQRIGQLQQQQANVPDGFEFRQFQPEEEIPELVLQRMYEMTQEAELNGAHPSISFGILFQSELFIDFSLPLSLSIEAAAARQAFQSHREVCLFFSSGSSGA